MKTNDPYISYIIPYYKGQDTIYACLDSIYSIGLSEKEFEIIVIDDCSPIQADLILLDYIQNHTNLRVIRHPTNTRQGGAKNTGIKAALGEYIAFADQDDIILPQGVRSVFQNISNVHPDIISAQYIYNYEGGRQERRGLNLSRILDGIEFCESYFDANHCVCPWGYFYRREFLLSLNYPMAEHVLLEASDWIEYHLVHAQIIQCIPIPIYQWNVLNSSTSHQKSPLHVASWIKLGVRKIQMAKKLIDLSPKYAIIIEKDGRGNIIGSFNRLWKSYRWEHIYQALGSDILLSLRSYQWPLRTFMMINYPKLSIGTLYIISPIKKLLAHFYRQIKY